MNDNTIKKVIIQPGCITCGACEFAAPEVFEVTDVSRVKPNVEWSKNQQCVKKAVEDCPVNVIVYDQE